jgi:Mycobacterium membrane protein
MSDVAQGPGWVQAADGKWYPPAPPAEAKPKRRFYKRVWFWLVLVVVAFTGGCIGIVASVSNTVDKSLNAKHTVVYEVTAEGAATASSVTWSSFSDKGNSGTSQAQNVAVPWTKTVDVTGDFSSFSLFAQLGSTGTSITCTIKVDGKQNVTNTSTGAFSTVTCSGTPPASTK